jgi:mRNA-degrading endonuclease toxin of MazEF toxin-antitoxin module
MRLSVICDPGEVVTVPFPFTDTVISKRRPALILSGRSFNLHGYTAAGSHCPSIRH